MEEQFTAGMYVVYGKTGVCRVTERQTMSVGGESNEYYVLSPVHDSRSSVFVPCGNPTLMARLRPLLTREQIDRILAGLEDVCMEWIDDRSERQSAFRRIMAADDRLQLMRMIRCIFRKKKERIAAGKHLSAMDETVLQDAVRQVEEEFAIVLDIPRSKVSPYILDRIGEE